MRHGLAVSTLLCALAVAGGAWAKTHTVATSDKTVDGSTLGVKAGDTICLQAGSRANLTIKNVSGSKAAPVLITNCGGRVRIDKATSHGLLVIGCTHFRLSGSGDASHEYGILIGKTPKGSQGLALAGKSSDYEVDHLEIEQSGFAGIMSKTDPSCADPDLRGFVQRNTHFHHNTIHDVGGEGFYVGYSWWPQRDDVDCSGKKVTFYPHAIEGVSIHHNRIERTGWDALQMGCARKDATIHHNVIRDYGLAKVQYQTSGMQINAGTAAHIVANDLRRGEGGGLIVFGLGGNRIVNNLLVDVGGSGIYVGDRADAGTSFLLAHNTIVRPKDDGIRFASRTSKQNHAVNNLVIAPGSGKAVVRVYKDVDLKDEGTLAPSLAAALFVDAAKGDFHLQAGSPAVDVGASINGLGITDDLDGLPRPDPSGKVDVGAYEHYLTPPADAGLADGGGATVDAGLGDGAPLPDMPSATDATSNDGAAAAGDGANTSGSEDGCAIGRSKTPTLTPWWLALLALAWCWRRRSRRQASRRR
jgi:hypothetical protein